ncbi:MAG: response regulator [Oscillospiraceae bacterium]|nr:response regulator [Oscillospiraceae bacterium]
MYRVMIIDDERSLRNLLKLTIKWDDYGLVVAGEAESGIEAINIIDEVKPDIIFVDIRMPFMDGIEFSKLAMKQYPDLKIIILTAFNDFEYARQCIGIGVCEYLTKPIVRNEVTQAIEKIVSELNSRNPKEKTDEGGDIPGSMKKICTYIKENFTNPQLNLTVTANRFGFNPSYFSRRFKESVGMSFVDYVTRCRMEKAMEYLHNKTAMYITAREVGIPDPNYFSKCFKKFTGKAYTELMKNETTG